MSGVGIVGYRRMPIYATLEVSIIIIIGSIGVKCRRIGVLVKACRSSLNAREAS